MTVKYPWIITLTISKVMETSAGRTLSAPLSPVFNSIILLRDFATIRMTMINRPQPNTVRGEGTHWSKYVNVFAEVCAYSSIVAVAIVTKVKTSRSLVFILNAAQMQTAEAKARPPKNRNGTSVWYPPKKNAINVAEIKTKTINRFLRFMCLTFSESFIKTFTLSLEAEVLHCAEQG